MRCSHGRELDEPCRQCLEEGLARTAAAAGLTILGATLLSMAARIQQLEEQNAALRQFCREDYHG